jgi:DNA-binding NtrC family response regulator
VNNFDESAKILVVDDEVALAEALKDLLVFHGYKVEFATNGISAIDLLDKNNFDLVISDIRMPMMDGMQLLQHINQNHRGLPVILISGFSDYDEKMASEKGARGLVAKPMDIENLVKLVKQNLKPKSQSDG